MPPGDGDGMQRILLAVLTISLTGLIGCSPNESSKDDKPDARIVVTAAGYDQLLKTSTKPIVLDFWASWCGPCKMMDPIFAAVAAERPDVIFGKVNVDQESALAQKYGIQAIPTLLVLVDGKVVKTSVGMLSKESLLQLVDEVVKPGK